MWILSNNHICFVFGTSSITILMFRRDRIRGILMPVWGTEEADKVLGVKGPN